MKQVISTKHRSEKQMKNMASNLREKFEEYCAVDYSFDANAHTGDAHKVSIKEEYRIYRASFGHERFNSWQELILGYYELMK